MKAIIMAGGEGRRLRPITGVRPKPMADVLGKPVLTYVIGQLKKYGFEDICITLCYMPEAIEEYFGDGSACGVHLTYSQSKEPLGTAGSVRNCYDFLSGEDVLILSGDAICDFDLSEIKRSFEESGADGLIVTYEHPEPTEYGVVLTDKDGNITGFSEKPGWENVTTNVVNTGIYALSNEAVKAIPVGREWDFGKDVFKTMLAEGKRLVSHTSEGYWCDIGSPEAYRQCCLDIIAGRTGFNVEAPQIRPGVYSFSELEDTVTLVPPVYVGEGCEISKGVTLNNCVIGSKSKVKVGSIIRNSVINSAKVGKKCRIADSVIGGGVRIKESCTVSEGAVLGDGVILGEDVKVKNGARIYTDVEIESGATVRSDMVKNRKEWGEGAVVNSAIVGNYGTEITTGAAKSWGALLGGHGSVGIAYTGGDCAAILMSAVELGANSVGAETHAMDVKFEAMMSFEVSRLKVDGAVFIRQEDDRITATFFGEGGAPIGRSMEREFTHLRSSDIAESVTVGGRNTVTGTERAYIAGAVKAGGDKKLSVKAEVYGSGAENRTLRRTLEEMGFTVCEESGTAKYTVIKKGFAAKAQDENGCEVTWEKLQAAAACCMVKSGRYLTVALPQNATTAMENMVANCGGKTVRNSGLLYEQRILVDGIYAASFVASYVAEHGITLSQLVSEVPNMEVSVASVKPNCSCAKAMRELSESLSSEFACEIGDNLCVRWNDAEAHVFPSGDGSHIIIRSEGETRDKSSELTERIKSRIDGEK